MTNNTKTKIVFDASCGISEEEQQEIFAKINRITEKKRLSLSASADSVEGRKKKLFKAKKTGSFFPIAVNAAAIAVLAVGFLVMNVFQGKTNAEVREGAKAYNSVEQALIEEIRRETSSNAAWEELGRLSHEQSQSATVESQLGALFANISRAINQNNLEEASRILQSMRDFLNTPAFQGLRSIQARKDLYTQAINSFEIMVDELRRSQDALASGILSLDRSAEVSFANLQERAAQLNSDVADRDRRLTETERTLRADIERERTRANSLQTQTETLRADVARETGRVNSLQEQVNVRDNTIRNQTATIANRNDVLEQIQNVIRGRSIADMTIGELSDSLSRIQNALQTVN